MKSVPNRLRNIRRRILLEQHLAVKRLKGEKVMYSLYTKKEIDFCPSRKHAKIVPFVIGEGKPTVIICPGGAYQFVSYNNEGAEIAKQLNKLGYNAFMVVYRVGRHARFPAPMEDLARAISFVKYNAGRFQINAEDFYLCGASAGGHLCAYFGAKYPDFEKPYCGKTYDLRPKGIILSYPVISLVEETHEVSCLTLLGECDYEEKRRRSVEFLVGSDYPPTFFWHCEGDKTVPISNSIRLDEKLSQLGVVHQFNRYPKGGHGIGLGFGTTAQGWIYDAVKFLQEKT
ncbi:MAG: alpha/beta hydrolase [Acutalibacteraceae bacterium]